LPSPLVVTDNSQRYYRAPCPGCGAPVEFRSAQSTHAVCPYCQSTVVRQGDTLARTGKMAELFDDFSPLQLFAAGRIDDKPFTLVGRLQYSYNGGRWTEWIAALDGGRTGILSEDNGAFVFTLPLDLQRPAPPAAELRVGATTAFNGQNYTVASNEQVSLTSAQGELPRLPELGRPFAVVELRNDKGQVLSLDYDTQPPGASLGRAVQLEDLQLTGLRDESAKDEKGRGFNCPNCGAPVTVNLADSKSITCRSCNSIIDLSQGIGGELKHAIQDEPVKPLIALGAVGRLQGTEWQVVGFQHRMGVAPGDDEHFGWNEYLLYNKKRGFSFLVDAEDGWSMVKPTTGAPTMAESGARATYLGNTYKQQYAYNAETTYVAGEFYWQVERGQKTFNRDFANGSALLSMERSTNELTWSAGSKMESAAVAAAFKLDGKKDMFKRSDALPVSAASGLGCGTIVLIVIVIIVLLIILSTCSSSSGSRSSGGSYGGYSSGGGHK
jgi:ribosomal protein S27E